MFEKKDLIVKLIREGLKWIFSTKETLGSDVILNLLNFAKFLIED